MENEFYAIIKLVSGEEILSLVSVDDSDDKEEVLLLLQNPIIVNMVHFNMGSYLKVKPWMNLNEDDLYFIKLDKVITMIETTNQKLIDIYNHYLQSEDQDESNIHFSINNGKTSGEMKVSEQNGYITSVESARKTLEKIFKGIKES